MQAGCLRTHVNALRIDQTGVMKKTIVVLGWTFLALLILVGGFAGYMAYVGPKLDASSKAYVDGQIPAIVSTWSEDELLKRAAPELRRVITSKTQLDRVFESLSRLGKLEHYDGAKGEASILFNMKQGKVVTASYVASAKFENGPARISVRLIRHGDQWELLYFNVNSPALMR